MQIPEHISVEGEPLTIERTDVPAFVKQETSVVRLMDVPDHIVLTGGDGYKGAVSQPYDIIENHRLSDKQIWLNDLPSKITLTETPYLDRDGHHAKDEHVRSASSVAVDENPLREMKKMRRQLGDVAGRLYQVEDEIEKQDSKEKLLFATIFGVAAAVLLFLFRR